MRAQTCMDFFGYMRICPPGKYSAKNTGIALFRREEINRMMTMREKTAYISHPTAYFSKSGLPKYQSASIGLGQTFSGEKIVSAKAITQSQCLFYKQAAL